MNNAVMSNRVQVYKFLCGLMCSVLSGVNLGVELWDYMITLCLTS